jgi:hypothetical protein
VTEPDDSNGKAGASARREHQRRKPKREANVRERHPRLGGVILALHDEPEAVARWERGAAGEETVAHALTKRCPDVPVLHDRRIPGSRANIDHIAIAPTGVWVIDTKRYKGKVQVANPFFGTPTLRIAGRDRTKLIDGLTKQVELVTIALGSIAPDVPVRGCLCFIDAELPLIGTPSINGYPMVGRRGLTKRLNTHGPLSLDSAVSLSQALADRFPAA